MKLRRPLKYSKRKTTTTQRIKEEGGGACKISQTKAISDLKQNTSDLTFEYFLRTLCYTSS